MVIDVGLRHADQLGDVPHRHGLIAALREQAGGCVEQLGSHIGHQKSSLVERPLSALVSDSPMAVQRACAEAIRTGDSANACASSCPAAPADTDARWMHDGAEFPWCTAAAGFDEQDLPARAYGHDAGTPAIASMGAHLERPPHH